MRWYHLLFTDLPANARYTKSTAWTCPDCRILPATVASLQTDMKKVLSVMETMTSLKADTKKMFDFLKQFDRSDILDNSSSTSDVANTPPDDIYNIIILYFTSKNTFVEL